MSTEAVQIEQRKANLEAITRLGFAAYPNKFDTTHTVSQLVDGYASATKEELDAGRVDTVTAGRIVSVRSFGKASFFVLSDGRSRLQVYVRQDALSDRDYQLSKLLDLGDQIGVSGHLFRTKTNELSIWASSLAFLAKCFLPLPEKWHGLQDVEIRYRQRYLDLIVNPDVRRVFEIRTATVAAIREFLQGHGFLEVETPMMQPIAGGALARPFVTHHNALDMKLYLRIAPELYLKRLTVGGVERVFEINRNFRNEGISTQHNPEFTMLEFYWAYVDYQRLMTFTEELLSKTAMQVIGTTQVPFGAHVINMSAPFKRLSLRHAAAEEASRRLGTTVTVDDLRSLDSAVAIARQLHVEGRRRRQGRRRDLRGAVGRPADPADVRLRFSDRSVAAVEAARRRSRHRRTLRALHRRVRSGQRLQRAQRPGRAAPPLRGPAGAARGRRSGSARHG
jgi:lysyl-tRNA synthetase, class II